MEALFVLFQAMIVAVRDLSAPMADALSVLLEQMRGVWEDFVEDKKNLQDCVYARERRITELHNEKVVNEEITMELRRNLSVFNNPCMWKVEIPIDFMSGTEGTCNRIRCIKALRAITNLGLKEAREIVEAKFEKREQLFNHSLTSKEMMEVVRALTSMEQMMMGALESSKLVVKLEE